MRCLVFSLHWLLFFRSMGSRLWAQQLLHTGLVALQHVGSSQTRDQTHVPCIGRGFLITGPPEKPFSRTCNTFSLFLFNYNAIGSIQILIVLSSQTVPLYQYVISLFILLSACCSVAQLCLTLCNPINCSTPVLPVHHHLPELAHH